jgi:hypothetical protein
VRDSRRWSALIQPCGRRGSVIFGVWVDGKKAADSGVMKGGDAPKLLDGRSEGRETIDARGDRRERRHGQRHANWGGALITLVQGADRPVVSPPSSSRCRRSRRAEQSCRC